MLRLHIDIPMPDLALAEGQQLSDEILVTIENALRYTNFNGTVQFRLGEDSDRGKKNYMDLDEWGHASTRKGRFEV